MKYIVAAGLFAISTIPATALLLWDDSRWGHHSFIFRDWLICSGVCLFILLLIVKATETDKPRW